MTTGMWWRKPMWINQPSTLQEFRHLHGQNVVVDKEGLCTFIDGTTMVIPPIALSNGHRQADLHERQMVLQRLQDEWEIGCRYLEANNVRTPERPMLHNVRRMLTSEEKIQDDADAERWQLLELEYKRLKGK